PSSAPSPRSLSPELTVAKVDTSRRSALLPRCGQAGSGDEYLPRSADDRLPHSSHRYSLIGISTIIKRDPARAHPRGRRAGPPARAALAVAPHRGRLPEGRVPPAD